MADLGELGAQVLQAAINFSASGNNTVVVGVAGKRIKVTRIFFVIGAATNLIFNSGSTALTGTMDFAANGAFVLDFDKQPLTCINALDSFIINSSNAVQIGGTIWYVIS